MANAPAACNIIDYSLCLHSIDSFSKDSGATSTSSRSAAINDVREYVEWIHTLTTLASIRQLNLEMVRISLNALTSLVCSFPDLVKVWLERIYPEDSKNRALLTDEQGRLKGRRIATRSLVDNRGTLSYPMLHASSSIRQVRVNNVGSCCSLEALKDWLYPEAAPLSLDLMPRVEVRSMAKLITVVSPFLEVLHVPTQGTDISQCECLLIIEVLPSILVGSNPRAV